MRILTVSIVLFVFLFSCSKPKDAEEYLNFRVDSVLSLMSLNEKIGQMAMLSSWGQENQPLNDDESYIEEIKAGRVGSMININGAKLTYSLQKIAVEESRLGIPLIFGFDVVHGYKTIFPIPIALSSTWNTPAVKTSAQIAAEEATAGGQHWTFAPMVDIARDPRWGRIAESPGEDPFLASEMAIAQIQGFQGTNLSSNKTIAACAKHFVAYGAAEGGRDYNTCEISDRTLHEIYLPPFKASAKNGVASIMMALNDLNGVPSSSSEELKNIIRKEWNYQSLLVSDWNSIGELVSQGRATSAEEAGHLAVKTSIDIDLQGNIYMNHLQKLVEQGVLQEKTIDQSVRRILKLKFKLGLFDNPYQYCNQEKEKETLLKESFKDIATNIATESIVLLKNEKNILPIRNKNIDVAIIGPLAKNKTDVLGPWRALGDSSDAICAYDGIKKHLPSAQIRYAKGCGIEGLDKSGFKYAIEHAKSSDIIIAVMGESSPLVNKTLSASDISLPGVQQDLLKEIKALGKPIILILLNGRPLSLEWEVSHIDAIVEAWFPGTMTGEAIGRIISGKVSPSGKLPVSLPYSTGQIPIYYNHKKFGRTPLPNSREQLKYDDGPVEALFPFGYGLSYTQFEYSDLTIIKSELGMNDTLKARVTVANTGEFDAMEVVQLYTRDLTGSTTRPIKELKGFHKVFIDSGQSTEVQFSVPVSSLAFYNIDQKFIVEPGEFTLMVGPSSIEYLVKNFSVNEKR